MNKRRKKLLTDEELDKLAARTQEPNTVSMLISEIRRLREIIAWAGRAEIESLEDLRQRLATWYRQCPKCGTDEGMGLTGMPKQAGHVVVWCANCGHNGPDVPRNADDYRASDRAAVKAWNQQSIDAWRDLKAEVEKLQAENAELRTDLTMCEPDRPRETA